MFGSALFAGLPFQVVINNFTGTQQITILELCTAPIVSYTWELRSSLGPESKPNTHSEFLSRFERADGSGVGTGNSWAYLYPPGDNGRYACVELTVTDTMNVTTTLWYLFTVQVDTVTAVSRRIEWD
jgi:hypothetical protein